MADNNSNPEYSNFINKVPPKEEVVTEKPYYDDVSAPTAQLLNNYNQSQSDNNDLPSKDNLPQGNQTISSEVPFYSSQAINNNSYEIDTIGRPLESENDRNEEKKKKLKIFLNILLIITVIGDSILLIIFNEFVPFILGDDIAVLIIAITYLILIGKNKRTNHPGMIAATLVVCIVGCGVKSYGIIKYVKIIRFFIPFLIFLVVRCFAMFFGLPKSCRFNNVTIS